MAGKAVIAAGVGALGAAAWWWLNADREMWGAEAMRIDSIDDEMPGAVRVASMRGLSASMLSDKNIVAMLAVIRAGEGTADAGGYSRLFGGGTFVGWLDHPRKAVKKWGLTSTAAGAYQILARTWDETKAIMGLPDFSPSSQDMAAIGRIAARGALNLVKAGEFVRAVAALNREWASLPGSPYGQKTMSMDKARAVYEAAGGYMKG